LVTSLCSSKLHSKPILLLRRTTVVRTILYIRAAARYWVPSVEHHQPTEINSVSDETQQHTERISKIQNSKAVNKEYHDRTRKLDSELHGTQQDQRGPIESELNQYGHKGRVLAPVIGRYGGASSDLSLILDLVARELARKHTAFYNIGFSEAKALFKQKLARKWGHAIARGWATLLLDRLRDFAVAPSCVI